MTIASSPSLSKPPGSNSVTGSDEPLAAVVMIRLWRRMTEIYGRRWSSTYGIGAVDDQEAMTGTARTWAKGLTEVGLPGIRRGLKRCLLRPDPWPPTLPEFLELCRPTPEEAGLPPAESAYRAACLGNWRLHPAVWHAARQVGIWELRREPESVTRPRFLAAYTSLLHRVLAGESLAEPIPAPALPHIPPTPEGFERERELIRLGANPIARLRTILRGGREGEVTILEGLGKPNTPAD